VNLSAIHIGSVVEKNLQNPGVAKTSRPVKGAESSIVKRVDDRRMRLQNREHFLSIA
jgi:hypothetical protein